jgi:pimeloyl-ACP methyl ester carboxylesterase
MWSGLNDHRWGPTMETRRTEIAPGMTFDVSVDGIEAAPLVLMLHGFGVSRFFWNSQVHALGDAGYFAVAPNQRGYAAGARPDPTDYASYRVDRLIGDALDIVAAVGDADRRFHLVGRDWGASHGRSQISTQNGWCRLPSYRARIPWLLLVRLHYRTASSGGGQGTIRHSWSRMLARTS